MRECCSARKPFDWGAGALLKFRPDKSVRMVLSNVRGQKVDAGQKIRYENHGSLVTNQLCMSCTTVRAKRNARPAPSPASYP